MLWAVQKKCQSFLAKMFLSLPLVTSSSDTSQQSISCQVTYGLLIRESQDFVVQSNKKVTSKSRTDVGVGDGVTLLLCPSDSLPPIVSRRDFNKPPDTEQATEKRQFSWAKSMYPYPPPRPTKISVSISQWTVVSRSLIIKSTRHLLLPLLTDPASNNLSFKYI